MNRNESYIARRTFRFAGRTYAEGEPFDARRAAVSTRKLAQLVGNRFVMLESEFDALEAKRAEAAKPKPKPKAAKKASTRRKTAKKPAKKASTRRKTAKKPAKKAPTPEPEAPPTESEPETPPAEE